MWKRLTLIVIGVMLFVRPAYAQSTWGTGTGVLSTELERSNNNLTVTRNVGTCYDYPFNGWFCWASVHGNNGKTTGKWYWEMTIDEVGKDDGSWTGVGFARDSPWTEYSIEEFGGKPLHGYIYKADGGVWRQNSQGDTYATYTTGDVIGMAWNGDIGGAVWWSKNCVWQQGDPATNTAPEYSSIGTGTGMYPAATLYYERLTSSEDAQEVTINYGAQSFTCTPPSGYSRIDEYVPPARDDYCGTEAAIGASETTAQTIIDRVRYSLAEPVPLYWSDSELLVWVNYGVRDIHARARPMICQEDITLTTATEYSLTYDYIGAIDARYIDTNGVEKGLIRSTPTHLGHEPAVGEPTWFYEIGDKIGVFPATSVASETLTVYFQYMPQDITLTDNVFLPAEYDRALMIFVIGRAWYKLGQYSKADYYLEEYYKELDRFRYDLEETPKMVRRSVRP